MMNTALITYACLIIGPLLLLACWKPISTAARALLPPVRAFLLRFFKCPFVVERHKFLGPISRGKLATVFAFFACIVTGSALGVGGRVDLLKRLGQLSIVHAVPLYLTSRFGFWADVFGFTLKHAHFVHRALALACFVQGIVHTALGASTSAPADPDHLTTGVMSAVSVAVLSAQALLPSRVREIAVWVHHAVGLAFVVSLWLHVRSAELRAANILLIAAMALFVLGGILRLAKILDQNLSWINRRATWTALSSELYQRELVKLTITLPRSMPLRPGQYVQLYVPTVDLFRSRPFVVVWWDRARDLPPGAALLVRQVELVLSRGGRGGWTGKFKRHVGQRTMPALLEGPYGAVPIAADFHTHLLLATGMGVFALLPFIKDVAERRDSLSSRARSVRVIWDVDDGNILWLTEYASKLLEQTDDMLQIKAYISKPMDGAAQDMWDRQNMDEANGKLGTRVTIQKDAAPDYEAILQTVLHQREGNLLVSVSSKPHVRDKVRHCLMATGCKGLRDVEFYETDYQP